MQVLSEHWSLQFWWALHLCPWGYWLETDELLSRLIILWLLADGFPKLWHHWKYDTEYASSSYVQQCTITSRSLICKPIRSPHDVTPNNGNSLTRTNKAVYTLLSSNNRRLYYASESACWHLTERSLAWDLIKLAKGDCYGSRTKWIVHSGRHLTPASVGQRSSYHNNQH